MLNREIPLFRNRRLEIRIPQADACTGKWISRLRDAPFGSPQATAIGRQEDVVEVLPEFSRRKRWVHRETQVGACAFKIRRDGESAADNGFVAESRRCPSEAETRLEVHQTVMAIIERPAVAILASKLDGAAGEAEVGLPIMYLHPRSVSFVAEAKVQGEIAGDAPAILYIPSEGRRALPPEALSRVRVGNTATVVLHKTEVEISLARSGVRCIIERT